MIRHFCPYWHGHDLPSILYRFVDDGKLVAYVYFEEEPDRRSAAKLLTKDEARGIAANIAKLEARGQRRIGATRVGDADNLTVRKQCR